MNDDKPRSRAEAFSALIFDRRISHGAFRLWHCLRDFQNAQTGACYPGQRLIVAKIGCNAHSLKGWTGELVSAGWLAVKEPVPGASFHYILWDGTGKLLPKTATPLLRKSATPPVAKSGIRGVAENHMRKTATKLIGASKDAPKEGKLNSSINPVSGNNAPGAQLPDSIKGGF